MNKACDGCKQFGVCYENYGYNMAPCGNHSDSKLKESAQPAPNIEKPPCGMCSSEKVQGHNYCSLCGRQL